MIEWVIAGAIAIFGFKKGVGILAEGFARGILIALALVMAFFLLLRGCTGA